MRILLDSCVWGGARAPLEAAGHEVEWVGEWPTDPGDEAILAAAHERSAVLVTIDKDFGELAVVRDRAHAGILRVVGFAARDQGPACVATLARYGGELAAGAMVTVERTRVRVRAPKGAGG